MTKNAFELAVFTMVCPFHIQAQKEAIALFEDCNTCALHMHGQHQMTTAEV